MLVFLYLSLSQDVGYWVGMGLILVAQNSFADIKHVSISYAGGEVACPSGYLPISFLGYCEINGSDGPVYSSPSANRISNTTWNVSCLTRLLNGSPNNLREGYLICAKTCN